jgi:hypothetical protein
MPGDTAPAPSAPIRRLLGILMMAAGLAITVVFGGGLAIFLWVDLARLADGSVNVGRLMSTLLVGPIVGGAPALLGLVLAQKGWRRWRSATNLGENP